MATPAIRDCNNCENHVQGEKLPESCWQCLTITENTQTLFLPFFTEKRFNNVRHIGLAGRAGSGKSTLAAALVRKGYTEYALAGPLKAGLKATFALMDEHFNDRDLKEKEVPWIGLSPRRLAQLYGTEFGRSLVADDIWLRCADQFIKGNGGAVVISDIRFENEAEWLRKKGGVLVHITRPGIQAVEGHASEAGIKRHVLDLSFVNDARTVEQAQEAFLKKLKDVF